MRLKLWLTLRDRRYNQGTWEGRALKFLLCSTRDCRVAIWYRGEQPDSLQANTRMQPNRKPSSSTSLAPNAT